MVCGLAETLTEFNGVFDNPDLNKAVSTILETVGEHKLALYEDEPPSDLATFPQLVDNCINALRAAEVHATETEDANQLYELLFAVGASKDWVSGLWTTGGWYGCRTCCNGIWRRCTPMMSWMSTTSRNW